MDVTQISIKINQTNQSDGKSNINSSPEVQENTFGQILQKWQGITSLPEIDSQTKDSLVDNFSEPIKSEENELVELSSEDLENLQSILSELFAVLQQLQPLLDIQQHPSVNNSSIDEVQASAGSTMLTSLNLNADESDQHLLKANVLNQSLTDDLSKLTQQTDSIIESLQTIQIAIPKEDLAEIETKLQRILDETKQINESGEILRSESQLINKELTLKPQQNEAQNLEMDSSIEVLKNIHTKLHRLIDALNPENKLDDRLPVLNSLDKNVIQPYSITQLNVPRNQLTFSPNQVTFSPNQEKEKLVADIKQLGESGEQKNFNIVPTVNQQIHEPKGIIPLKTEASSPFINLSTFVPEVSEWIGRNMRITNGQPGMTEAKLSLYPEHFGHLEIKINSQQGHISAQIVTNTIMAKEALEGQLEHLSQALKQHGILVQKLDIVHQPTINIDVNHASPSFSHGGSSSSHEQRNFRWGEEKTKKQKDSDPHEIEKVQLNPSYGGAALRKESRIDFTA